jgi:DNA polymerase/3'-5' exonuclease PolX
MSELEKIYGIGPVKAKEILTKGVNGVKINPNKPIRPQLKKVSQYLSVLTQADLHYNPNKKMKRKVIQEFEKQLSHNLKIKHDIAGSYRRGKPISKDIDLIVKHKPFTYDSSVQLINKINQNNKFKIIHTYMQGPYKMGVILQDCRSLINYKMDIFAATENYIFMLLFATGSGEFNIKMRAIAKHKNMLLNQNGLFSAQNKRVNVKNEKELFKILNIDYVGPQDRN